MKNSAPDISVVSITYNSLDDTLRMIRSLKDAVRSVSLEIVVVDNASRRDETAEVTRLFPDVRTIRSPRNLGFSGGNNLGLAAATGRYVMLLNNDAYIERDGLGELVRRMDSDPSIGACSPKILFAAPPHRIQFAGFTPLTGITVRNRIEGYMEDDRGQWDAPREIPYAHGAAMMVSRAALEAAGPMPEQYFLYYEELDWSMAIRRCGFRIWYEPACTVFHRDGQAGRPPTPLRCYFMARNRMLLAWRNSGRGRRWLSVGYLMFVAAPKNAATALLDGRFAVASAIFRAEFGFLFMKKAGNDRKKAGNDT